MWFFKVVKCSSIENVNGWSVVFTILHKKEWIIKINKKMLIYCKIGFIKLLVYFYTMIQLPINCILMGLIIYFMFEYQINYSVMVSKKISKWVKYYVLLLFILYVILVFPKIVYIVMCFHLGITCNNCPKLNVY